MTDDPIGLFTRWALLSWLHQETELEKARRTKYRNTIDCHALKLSRKTGWVISPETPCEFRREIVRWEVPTKRVVIAADGTRTAVPNRHVYFTIHSGDRIAVSTHFLWTWIWNLYKLLYTSKPTE